MKDSELLAGNYVLKDGDAWFTIKKFSVRIFSTDEGVVCDIYALGNDEESIASAYAFDDEAE